jgi:hypothetical protein
MVGLPLSDQMPADATQRCVYDMRWRGGINEHDRPLRWPARYTAHYQMKEIIVGGSLLAMAVLKPQKNWRLHWPHREQAPSHGDRVRQEVYGDARNKKPPAIGQGIWVMRCRNQTDFAGSCPSALNMLRIPRTA